MAVPWRSFFLILLIGFIAACANAPQLSRDKAIQQHESIVKLSGRLGNMKNAAITHLAPSGFEAAAERLEMAIEMARQKRHAEAEQLVKEGNNLLRKALLDVKNSNKVMREVLAARQRAINAGVLKLRQERLQFETVELKLYATTREIEHGEIDKAKKRRAKLLHAYADLELRALKKNILRKAMINIRTAKKNAADEYAPKTFLLAEKELELAAAVLNADRTQTQKAKTHAMRASWLAKQSKQITDIVKSFEWSDYTPEEIVIWYQEQLAMINNAIGGALPFDRPNRDVVLGLRDSIKLLIDAEQVTAKKLETQKGMLTEMGEIEVAKQKAQQRYDRIQALFPPSFANVYRQGDNVLLETHAFNFPSGASEIHSENFELLNKIIQAIKEFSNYRVVVTGHTDSTGSAEINRDLSLERAKKVVAFLDKVGGIDISQTEAKGFGESRPVASNKTDEGRARNRRIEVLIIKEAFARKTELVTELN